VKCFLQEYRLKISSYFVKVRGDVPVIVINKYGVVELKPTLSNLASDGGLWLAPCLRLGRQWMYMFFENR